MVANTRNFPNISGDNLEKGTSITVVDSVDDKIARKNCCFCIPVRFGVFAILSMYLFFGLFGTATSFASLAFVSQTSEIFSFTISGFFNVFLTIISALGINAIKKEKAVAMHRLSIAFWIFTVFMFIFKTMLFIVDIIYKPSSVKDCEETVKNLSASNGENNVDCTYVVNVNLGREALTLFFTETISVYFAIVIFKYANQMLKLSQSPPAYSTNDQRTPTYYIYTTQPPTSNDWNPPPIYTPKPFPDGVNPDQASN